MAIHTVFVVGTLGRAVIVARLNNCCVPSSAQHCNSYSIVIITVYMQIEKKPAHSKREKKKEFKY